MRGGYPSSLLLGSMPKLLYYQFDAMLLQSLPSVILGSHRDLVTSVLRKPLGLVSPGRRFAIHSGRHTFLHFHLVKQLVSFYGLGHWHDIIRHESTP